MAWSTLCIFNDQKIARVQQIAYVCLTIVLNFLHLMAVDVCIYIIFVSPAKHSDT